MKVLLKLAAGSLLVIVVLRIVRQWQRMQSDSISTVQPVRDAEPSVAEPLQPEDLRVAQNSPL